MWTGRKGGGSADRCLIIQNLAAGFGVALRVIDPAVLRKGAAHVRLVWQEAKKETYRHASLSNEMPPRLLFAMSRNAVRMLLLIAGLIVVLFPFGLGAVEAGAATTKQSETAHCVATVSSHSTVTKSEVSACDRSSLKVTHPCPKGSTIFVVRKGTTYALRSGAKPTRLPKHASLALLNKACGLSAPSQSVTTTTAVEALPATPPTTQPAPPFPPVNYLQAAVLADSAHIGDLDTFNTPVTGPGLCAITQYDVTVPPGISAERLAADLLQYYFNNAVPNCSGTSINAYNNQSEAASGSGSAGEATAGNLQMLKTGGQHKVFVDIGPATAPTVQFSFSY